MKRPLAILAALALCAAAQRPAARTVATASLAAGPYPYVPGSLIALALDGTSEPAHVEVLGAGTLDGTMFTVSPNPNDGAPTIVAASRGSLAMQQLAIAPPPDPKQPFLAVASYDAGIVFHEAAPPFRALSALGIGGAPSDVAIDPSGRLAAGTTNGDRFAIATLAPWAPRNLTGIPFSDEVAVDPSSHAVYATNRDVNGAGALTRIAADGTVTQRVLGLTAEGLAIDAARGRAYVANVNDGTISIVDLHSMVELRRFPAVARVFSLALSGDGSRLYATSNQSLSSLFSAAGSAVAFDVTSAVPRRIARSKALSFPLGIALDERRGHVIVTDESDNTIDVLSLHLELLSVVPTCRTPWKPTVDGDRLYVPCARSDEVDAIDLRTLHRIPGAPFATGGYPLGVAVWHP